ncbi:hypothetical protein C7M84_022053 [Penaeus vannamei]|uniref:Uncharacterized protein n=1 Tax=Penaeus vannamei TaxID=6689 RepID=A0A423U7S7_PENVA|nr:hypothetical protein C7M84_022053 [Penaeus vannamei]
MSTNFPSHSRSCIPILYRAQPQTRRGAQAVLMANPRHEAVKNDLLEAVKSRESGAYLDEIDSFLKQKKKYCADDVNLAHQILDVCLVSDIFEKELDDVNGRLKEKKFRPTRSRPRDGAADVHNWCSVEGAALRYSRTTFHGWASRRESLQQDKDLLAPRVGVGAAESQGASSKN